METWSIVQGFGGKRIIQIRDEFENPITIYTGTEPLKGTVGPGRSYIPNLTLTPSWLNPPQGTLTVTISAAQSATLEPGQYLLDVGLTDSSAAFYEGFLGVAYGPGTLPIPPTYGAYTDLIDAAPWIEKLQTNKLATGFLTQRAAARSWLDQIIINSFSYASLNPTAGQPGFMPLSLFPAVANAPPSLWLRQQLDLGALIQRDEVRTIVALKAIGEICQSQLARLEEQMTQLGADFEHEAEQMVMALRAEITLNVYHPNNLTNTWPSITVDCGYRSLRG